MNLQQINIHHGLKKFKGEFIYIVSSYAEPMVLMIANLIAARYIMPKEFGIIQSVMLVSQYTTLLHLGTFNGVNRNLAFNRAQHNQLKEQKIINASFTVATLQSILGFLIGLFLLFFYFFKDSGQIYLFSCLALIITLICTPFTLHHDTLFKSSKNFSKFGKLRLFENSLMIALSLLPIIFNYFGRILFNIFKAVLKLSLRIRYKVYKTTGRGEYVEIKDLIKVGFPILVSGYLFVLINIADQSIIALYLGPQQVGYYTVARLIIMTFFMIPVGVNAVIHPRISETYGKFKNNKSLKKFFWYALMINILIFIPLCTISYFFLSQIINIILPNYTAGIDSGKIAILSCLGFIANGPGIIISITRNNKLDIIILSILLGLFWGIGTIVSKRGGSIEDIAWIRLCVFYVLALFRIGYGYYLTTKDEFRE